MIAIGDFGSHVAAVAAEDTAEWMGSGNVPVLATPRVIAWMEAAAIAALRTLPKGTTSVGTHIAVDHLAASHVGAEVRAEAEVRAVEERKIEFEVRAFAREELIADGTHTRVIVDRRRFLSGVV